MKQQEFDLLINGLQQLIIQAKINGIKQTPNISRQLLKHPLTIPPTDSTNPSFISLTLSSLFQKLNIKPLTSQKTQSNSLKISFKLIANEKKKILATEIWQLHWAPIISDQKVFEIQRRIGNIQGFVRDVVEMSSALPNWKCFIENKGERVSNCYISYQISQGGAGRRELGVGLASMELQASFEERALSCKVQYGAMANFEETLKSFRKQKEPVEITKKRSIDTMVTCYSQGISYLPGLSRKVSIYSYYDPDNDITFLSNDEFSLQRNTSCTASFQFSPDSHPIPPPPCPQQYEDEQECEMILTQDDCKLFKFQESLKQLSTLPHSSSLLSDYKI